MAAGSTAYWIDPQGRILKLTEALHITQITSNPEKFGFTREQITKTYAKYGERIGTEGKAREEIIKDALARGFIRVRLYPNRYWSVTTNRYDSKAKKALKVWAEQAQKDRFAGPYISVKITDLSKEKVYDQFTVSELAGGNHLYEDYSEEHVRDFNPRFVNEMTDFGLPVKVFKKAIKQLRS